MSARRSRLGAHWESIAAKYLQRNGLTIIERGYRCRLGELDLVCHDGSSLVVVEVRARATTAYANALDSVSRSKREKIVKAARHSLMLHPQWFQSALRFDVIAIDGIDTNEPRLDWHRNAFDGG